MPETPGRVAEGAVEGGGCSSAVEGRGPRLADNATIRQISHSQTVNAACCTALPHAEKKTSKEFIKERQIENNHHQNSIVIIKTTSVAREDVDGIRVVNAEF